MTSTLPGRAPSSAALLPEGAARAAFDSSPDAIWSADTAGVCHYANPAAAALFGRPRAELVGADLHELTHVPVGAQSGEPVGGCAACSAPPGEGDAVTYRHADGTPVTVHRRGRPVLADGVVVGAVTRLLTSGRPEDSGTELGGVLATTADAFVGMDHAGRINGWNAAAESLLGWTTAEAMGRPLVETMVPPELQADYGIGLDALYGPDESVLPAGPVEMQVLHRDGRRLEVELTVGRMRRAGEWQFHAFLRDVTERRAAEASLARSEELHRLLAENSGDLISQHAPDGTIRYVSPAVLTVLDRTPEALVGCRALDLVHPDDVGALIDREGQFRADAGRGELTFRLRHGDGHWVWVEAVSSVLRAADGSVAEIHMCTRDITDRKARDAEVHRESKLESLGRLSAGLAHEINTPIQYVGDNARFLAEAFADLMTMVALYRELLEHDDSMSWGERRERMRAAEARIEVDYLQTEVPSAVEQTLQGIDRVANIVRAMKTFSHPGHAEHVPADLNEALAATVTVTRHQVSRVADLDLDLGELPPVLCNIADLNQVFLNLIVNAADAVEETGRRGRVAVSSVVEGDQVAIRISDTGTGIPDHVRAKIFDPFFTTKDVGRGTGQGLPLARAVVQEAHGGTLTVRSEPGAGSTFTVRLPIGVRDRGTGG